MCEGFLLYPMLSLALIHSLTIRMQFAWHVAYAVHLGCSICRLHRSLLSPRRWWTHIRPL